MPHYEIRAIKQIGNRLNSWTGYQEAPDPEAALDEQVRDWTSQHAKLTPQGRRSRPGTGSTAMVREATPIKTSETFTVEMIDGTERTYEQTGTDYQIGNLVLAASLSLRDDQYTVKPLSISLR